MVRVFPVPESRGEVDHIVHQYRAESLNRQYCAHSAADIIKIADLEFGAGLAAISSFGADSAVLLHLIARVNRDVPVLFLQTGKHFPATLRYRDELVEQLGLTQVRDILPDALALQQQDPRGALCLTNKDQCCDLRKVEPMARGIAPFQAWLTGRKQFQAATRHNLPVFEAVEDRIRINPLSDWSAAMIESYRQDHDLPPHPLVQMGYRSIGCIPCTRPVGDDEDQRAGRWSGSEKTECGIHLGGVSRILANNKQVSSDLETTELSHER